jgi:hypothetical protein
MFSERVEEVSDLMDGVSDLLEVMAGREREREEGGRKRLFDETTVEVCRVTAWIIPLMLTPQFSECCGRRVCNPREDLTMKCSVVK